MAAEVDFRRRSEPAKVKFWARAEPLRKGGLREIHLCRHILHPCLVSRFGQHANRRGVAGETTISERVDLADANAHVRFLCETSS